MDSPIEILTMVEFSQRCGLCTRTLRNIAWKQRCGIRTGHTPIPFRKLGNRLVITRADAIQWLEANAKPEFCKAAGGEA